MSRPRAKRMSPDERRQSIVESAIELILKTGTSACSLEQVAAHAGISKPLIYKYFSRREELMEAIVEHEFRKLRGSGLDRIPKDVAIEDLMRGAIKSTLRYYYERGPILALLSSEPSIAGATRTGSLESRATATEFFVQKYIHHFRVPREVALIVVTMTVNAPIHSMKFLKHNDIDVEQAIDVWATFVIGGWHTLQDVYGK